MIRQVRISNFKSFKDAVFELSPLTLVLGSNASGKSNFFDALRFLRFVGEGTSIRDAIEGHAASLPTDIAVPGIRGGASDIAHFSADSRVFELEVVIETSADRLTYSISVDADTYRVVAEELKSEKQHPGPYVFSTRPDVNPLTQDPESPVIAARFYKETRGPNPKRDFSPHTSILSQFEGRRAESRANESIAEAARVELQSISPLELRPEVLRQYAPLGVPKLGEHGENFPAVVWWLTNDPDEDEVGRVAAIESWLAELTPHPIVEVTTDAAPTGEVIFAVREEPHPDRLISARSLSDGTLRYAALAFAILGDTKRRTLLIEEIENGINPARIELLLRMIEEVAADPSGVQVVATTHSPNVLDLASEATLENALVIGWDTEEASSRVTKLGHLPNLKEIREKRTIGQLQAEGWIQYAADA